MKQTLFGILMICTLYVVYPQTNSVSDANALRGF